MDEDNNFQNINNNQLSVIDEKPELTTLVAATEIQNNNDSYITIKILSKLSKGYTFFTVVKVISYSINETSFIFPYCLRKLGIIPFFFFLIIFSISSVYIFYLIIDIIVKHNLFNNYHKIIQEKSNKIYNIIYYIINIIYNTIVLIFENYLYISLCQQIFSIFGINIDDNFYEKLIILSFSFIFIEFPLSFIKFFHRPDFLYIIILLLNIILNIISLILIFINKSKEDGIKITKLNLIEGVSKDYLICFSIIMTVMGWQNQISKQLQSFKIKTSKRFYKVIYYFFIVQNILIIFFCLVSTPLINSNDDFIFLLDIKNTNLSNIIIIQIMVIIFSLVIHIIIAHHMQLIRENMVLILSLTIYKNDGDNFIINIIFALFFNFFILFITNIIALFIDDISLIIILYGGIFSTIINYIIPTIMYWMMISKNSVVLWLAGLIDFVIISLGISALVLKIIS